MKPKEQALQSLNIFSIGEILGELFKNKKEPICETGSKQNNEHL